MLAPTAPIFSCPQCHSPVRAGDTVCRACGIDLALEGRPGFVWLAQRPDPDELDQAGAQRLTLLEMYGMAAATASPTDSPTHDGQITEVRSSEDLESWFGVYSAVFRADPNGRDEIARTSDRVAAVVAYFPPVDIREFGSAVAIAAFPAWAALPPTERRRRLLKAADLMEQRAPDFIAAGVLETGGTRGWYGFNTKLAAGMLRELGPACDQMIFTRSTHPRSLPPATLATLARQLGGPPAEVVASARAAVERGRELAGPDGAVLATGSIYLIADLVRDEGAARASAL